jgi:hypothetical protein
MGRSHLGSPLILGRDVARRFGGGNVRVEALARRTIAIHFVGREELGVRETLPALELFFRPPQIGLGSEVIGLGALELEPVAVRVDEDEGRILVDAGSFVKPHFGDGALDFGRNLDDLLGLE